MNFYKKILSNSFYLYLIQGINFIFPLLLIPYIIKVFTIESYGIYTFAFSFIQIVSLFIDFGFHLPLVRKVSISDDKSYHIELFWRVTIAKSIMFILCIIGSIILLKNIDQFQKYQVAIFYAFPMAVGNIIFPVWLFQGINKMKTLGILTVVSKLFIIPLVFIYVKSDRDLYLCIFIQSTLILVSSILSVSYLKRIYKDYFFFKKQNVRKILLEVKDSFPMFLSNSSIMLYTHGLIILLGYFGTADDVGLYGVYDKIIKTISGSILTPVVAACFPIISKASIDNLTQANKLYNKIFYFFIGGILLIILTFLCFKPFVINSFLKNYLSASNYYFIFIGSLLPIAVGSFIGQLGIVAMGDRKADLNFSKVYLLVGLVSVPVSIISIGLYTLNGSIFAMYFAEILILISMIYYKYRSYENRDLY